MADNFGLKIGIEGEKEFKIALREINQSFKVLGSEMKLVSSAFDKNDKSIQAMTAKNEVLNKSIDAQKERISTLESALKNAAESFGENDRRTQAWQIQLNHVKAALNDMERELAQSSDEADKLSEGLEESSQSAEQAGARFEKLGGVLKGIGVAMGAAAVAAGAAALKLGKEVVRQFGELEQNLGGSEAVFGKYAAAIQKTGEEAYKNLGVSQNSYLATANKMGALFQGSGIEQQKSLELTEKAMQRAADMASVMGVDMQMALDSIAGAAKGNFTMMDNLGVAMNATNIEAYALAKGLDFTWKTATQAEKAEMAMQMFFESTQQYAGNFAREATQTITGSLGMLRAAVGSFTAGLGNADADMKKLTQNLVEAFQAVVSNIVPVLENLVTVLPMATGALLAAIGALLPDLLKIVTQVFTQVLDVLLSLLPELIPAAVGALMTIAEALIDNLPLLMQAATALVTALVTGIGSALPRLLPATLSAITTIVDGLIENLPLLLEAALQLILGLVEGLLAAIPQLVAALPAIIDALVSFLISAIPQISETGVLLLAALIQNLPAIIVEIVKAVPQIVAALVKGFAGGLGQMAQVGDSLIKGLWQGITDAKAWLWEKISGFFGDIVAQVKAFFGIHSPSTVFAELGGNMALGLGAGFTENMSTLEKGMGDSIPTDFAYAWQSLAENADKYFQKIVADAETVWTRLSNFLRDNFKEQSANFSAFLKGMNDFADNNWSGLKSTANGVWTDLQAFFTGNFQAVKSGFEKTWREISRFAEAMWQTIKTIGISVWTVLGDFLTANWHNARISFETIWYGIRGVFISIWTGLQAAATVLITGVVNNIKAAFNIDWWSVGRSIIDGITGGVMAAAQSLASAVANAARAALDAAKSALGIHSPSTVFRDEVGLQIGAGLAEGLEKSRGSLTAGMNRLLDSLTAETSLRKYMPEGILDPAASSGTAAGGITQNITIISPKPLSERELAREFQNTSRKLAMGVV